MFGMYSLPHLYQIIRQIPSKSLQKQAFQNVLNALYKAKLVIFVTDCTKPFNKQENDLPDSMRRLCTSSSG